MNLGHLQNSVLALTVIGIVLVAGLLTMSGLQSNLTPNSAAYNATGQFINSLTSLGNILNLSPEIIDVIVVGVGAMVGLFVYKRFDSRGA